MKYLKEQGYEIDDTISEEVIGFGEVAMWKPLQPDGKPAAMEPRGLEGY